MEELLLMLKRIRPDVDFENETQLIDGGFLDSFDIVSIIAELDYLYNIEVKINELTPENFNSLAAIYSMVLKLRNEKQ